MYEKEEITKVQWFWSTKCNYDCAYCPKVLHNNKIELPDPEVFLDAIDYIGRLIRLEGRSPCFEFTGGEPSLMPFLEYALKQGQGNSPPINQLTTNGSASLEWFDSIYHFYDYIEISYHPGWSKIDHIIEVVRNLKQKEDAPNVTVVVNLDNHDGRWLSGVAAYERFRKIGIRSKLKLLYSNFGKGTQLYPYKTYQLEYYYHTIGKKFNVDKTVYWQDGISQARQRHDIKKQDLVEDDFNYKGKLCNIGLETLVVYSNGDVYRGWCKTGGVLGNVFSKDVVLPSTPVLCDKSFCRNGFDREATKLTAGSI